MINDIRYAVRTLARSPLFTAGAIATLALGIGVNSTIFTLANAALFRSMPAVSDPGRLAWVSAVQRESGRTQGLSFPDYTDFREASRNLFDDMMAFRPTPLSLGSGGEPQRIRGHLVTGSYFGALGVTPAIGRLIGTTDDAPGQPRPVAVLSHRLWQQRFGGAIDIPGTAITINGQSFAVIGVAPVGFSGPALGEGADIWIPVSLWPQLHAAEPNLLASRDSAWLMAMGRLRRGVSASQAQAALAGVALRLAHDYPDTNRDRLVSVSAAGSSVSPQGRSELLPLSLLLLAVTGLVLLIACANIANLLLARGAARASEIGVRVALGASRGRIVRQLLTESAVLAGAGAMVGLLVSVWGADLLVSAASSDDFLGLTAAIDFRVLSFTILLSGLSVCVFGLVPAITATRRSLVPALRETAGGGSRSRIQGLFVVAQLALSLVLLLGAGLSVRALQHAAAIDLGFAPRGVLTASYDLVLQNYPADRRDGFRRDMLVRIRAIPTVTNAAIANVAPVSGTLVGIGVSAAEGTPDARSITYVNAVGPGFFATLGVPIRRGRAIDERDTRGAPGAVVINETLARQLWGDGDPIGRRVRMDGDTLQVVGLARNGKYDEPTEDPLPFLYTSIAQRSMLDRDTLLVRTSAPPATLAAAVTAAVHEIDPSMPVFDVRPLEDVLVQRMDKQRAISGLVAGSGLLALLLAAVGLYGVMAYVVTRRTREFGVRLALGATPRQLTALIARDGVRLAAAGVVIGSLLALPLAKVLGALVFGVAIGDLAGFAGACALLVGVALVAAVLPARRAGHLDPIAALRME